MRKYPQASSSTGTIGRTQNDIKATHVYVAYLDSKGHLLGLLDGYDVVA
jgi:hypothetical protein